MSPSATPPYIGSYDETVAYFAELGIPITYRQLRRLVSEKKIAYTRVGLRTLFTRDGVDKYLASRTVQPGQR